MAIKIVTDTASDLNKPAAEELGISMVPLYINIGNKSYLDGIDISREEFYTRLPMMEIHPTTSAPGPDAFINTYERLIDEGATGIISIHVSSTLSAVHNVATLAAENIKRVPIKVIDAGNLSMGTGLIAMMANTAARAGKSMDEIVHLIQDTIRRTHTIAILDTLEYLKRSGRMSHIKFRLATMLDIKPMIRMMGGEVKLELIRTRKQALKRLTEEVEKLATLEKLVFVHTHAPSESLDVVRERLSKFLPAGQAEMFAEVTPVIGAHIGPGAVGVSLVTNS